MANFFRTPRLEVFMFPTFSVDKQRRLLLCSTILSVVLLVQCNAFVPISETQLSTTSSPTLSLLTTWEMQGVTSASWHPLNDMIAVSGWDRNNTRGVWLYDIQTGEEVWFKENVPGGLAFAPDGMSIAITPFYEAHVQILAPEEGKVISDIEANNCSAGHWLQFDGEGKRLLTGLGYGHVDWETTINIWDVQTGKCKQLDRRSGLLTFLDIHNDFKYAAMSIYSNDHRVYIRNLEAEEDVCTVFGEFALFTPSTNQFVVINADQLSFYEVETCQPARNLVIEPPYDGYFAFSPNGEIFATSGNNKLQLWDTNTGKLLHHTNQPEKFFDSRSRYRLLFSPNGEYLLAVYAALDNNNEQIAVVQVWELLAKP